MLFKEDWEQCKKRLDAFWNGEIVDRCCVSVLAPRNKRIDLKIEQKEAGDLIEKWTSSQWRMDSMKNYCNDTFFGGEAFPSFWVNLGPGVVASFMGSPYMLAENTVWFDRKPMIDTWDNTADLKFDPESEMWKIVKDMTGYIAKNSEGRFMVSMTDLGGTLDIAASFRGTETLLYDLIDYPEQVKALCSKIDDAWIESYNRLNGILSQYQEGTVDWYPLWCRERSYALQCDFSAMLSPALFEEFVVPSLTKQANFLDKSIYHWDGPGQIPHLEQLLDIKPLTAIQWTPGNGKPGACDECWFPLYRRIQKKGKRLILLQVDPTGIEKLLDNISPEGLMLYTHCDSEDEAQELLRNIEKWSK